MKGLSFVPLLTMLFLLPLPAMAQQASAPPPPDPVAKELSSSLHRVANALERVLESQRADVELKKIEVASRILQLHWEQITQLRNAAETAEEKAASAEQNQKVMLAELDILSARERELRDTPESDDNSGERRESIRLMKEERQKLESYIEQDKDRSWRMRDQASVYQAEMKEIRAKVAHLEEVIARWLDDLR
jgi:hypothetical protein